MRASASLVRVSAFTWLASCCCCCCWIRVGLVRGHQVRIDLLLASGSSGGGRTVASSERQAASGRAYWSAELLNARCVKSARCPHSARARSPAQWPPTCRTGANMRTEPTHWRTKASQAEPAGACVRLTVRCTCGRPLSAMGAPVERRAHGLGLSRSGSFCALRLARSPQ